MNKPTFEDLAALSLDDLRSVRRQVEAETVQRALADTAMPLAAVMLTTSGLAFAAHLLGVHSGRVGAV